MLQHTLTLIQEVTSYFHIILEEMSASSSLDHMLLMEIIIIQPEETTDGHTQTLQERLLTDMLLVL